MNSSKVFIRDVEEIREFVRSQRHDEEYFDAVMKKLMRKSA